MSTTVMSFCWPLRDLSPTQKALLIALADAANDDGVCWIAVKSRREDKLDLMVKTCLSERAVQEAMKALVEMGYVERNEKPGLGCWYIVTPPGFLAGRPPEWLIAQPKKAPASGAGVREARPETPAGGARTPAPAAGKPSSTPSKKKEADASSSSRRRIAPKRFTVPDDWEPKDAHREKVEAFGWPDGMMTEQLERFREWEFRDGKTDFDRAFHRWLRMHNEDHKGRTNDDRYHFASPGAGAAPRRGTTARDERLGAMQRGAMAALDRRGR